MTQNQNMLAALYEALPFVECDAAQNGFKPGFAKAVARRIRTAIADGERADARGKCITCKNRMKSFNSTTCAPCLVDVHRPNWELRT